MIGRERLRIEADIENSHPAADIPYIIQVVCNIPQRSCGIYRNNWNPGYAIVSDIIQ